MSELKDRLRRARISQGLTLAELGRKIGVSGGRISQWEQGYDIPTDRKSELELVLGSLEVQPASTSQITSENVLQASAFSAWLSRARAEAGLSVPELARAAGLSTVAIYNLESGRSRNPQSETKDRLEKALNKSVPEDVKEEINEEQKIEGLGALTDFDPHDQGSLPKVPGVYVFYDVSERPIYIGKASNIASRVQNHSEKFWFRSPIVYAGSYIEIPDEKVRHQVEQVLIKFLKSNAVINKQSVDRS